MSDISVYFKDGTVKHHNHTGRAGGSYTKTIQYASGFAIVTDEWGNQTIYPGDTISEIRVTPHNQEDK